MQGIILSSNAAKQNIKNCFVHTESLSWVVNHDFFSINILCDILLLI